jgi:autotransporter-associated beta strand protein
LSYTLAVGSNHLDRTFSGSIQDGGGRGKRVLKKVGRGTLTLAGGNTYTGETIATRGSLLVTNLNGSATGSGPVLVSGGSLGGNGIIAGAVTIGRGSRPAFLEPGIGSSLGILTIQSTLILNPVAKYEVEFDSNSLSSDQVVANGVTISSGTTITITDLGAGVLSSGMTLTIIDNTAITPIAGSFDNLSDASTITIGSNTFEVSYEGGDGNDLTLTVVP